jgi:hypothetical protein
LLARVSSEPASNVALAVTAAGWTATSPTDAGDWDNTAPGDEEILALGSLANVLDTVAELADLAAVVRIGNPLAPLPTLENHLLKSDPSLMVIAVTSIELDEETIWFGLVDTVEITPEFASSAQVWLAFGPSNDYRGSLKESLGLFADLGLDLTNLRSQRPDGRARSNLPHHFFTSFRCGSSAVLEQLVTALTERAVKHRVLGVVPGADFGTLPGGLVPQWSN